MDKDFSLKAVTDNWLLEFGLRAIEGGLPLKTDGFGNNANWARESVDYILALLQLLDLMVLNDELLYEKQYSSAWAGLKSAQKIKDYLVPFSLNQVDRKKLVNEFNINPNSFGNEYNMTWFSALWYYGFSKASGLNYWPAPERSRFLKQHCFDILPNHFVGTFKGWFKDNLDFTIKESLKNIPNNLNDISFPGFGYLSICESNDKEGILNNIIEIRNSRSTKAFRKWLNELDNAQNVGNLKEIIFKFSEIQDMFNDIRKDLGLAGKDLGTEVHIGISPGIKFKFSSIQSFFNYLKPKPLHITFLRKNIHNYFSKTDTILQLSKLFPEVKEHECAVLLSSEL